MDEITKEARKRLLNRRKTIETSVADLEREETLLQAGAHPDLPDRAAHRTSAVHRTPIEVLESIRGARRSELSELEAALERIEKGGYGTCQTCGGAVGRQRLRAIPEARFCIDCVSARSHRVATS
jgi:DnaK suppressor protein